MTTKQRIRKNTYQRCRSIAIGTAVAMPLCIATTGTVTMATVSLTALPAHALGWSDITGSAKKPTAITSRNQKSGTGRSADRRKHSRLARSSTKRKTYKPGEWGGNQQTSAKLPPARRPARKLPPPRNQRPRPITENDVKPPFCNSKFENCSKPKPSRPFCNSKFENCSKPPRLTCNSKFENCSGKHKRKGKKYNGRDRSVWGRPVGDPRKGSKGKTARDKSVWGRPLKLKKSSANKRRLTRDLPINRKSTGKVGRRSATKKGSFNQRNLRKNVRANKTVVRGDFKRKIKRPASIRVKPRSVRRNAKRIQLKRSQRRIDRGFKTKRFKRNDRRKSSRRSNKRRG